eukprot:TRINITY_DN12099_c0_g1_i2.p1 TRINITY_DN12099_c0_g1~~TRINITY_DN12099_c0_g1_i2.p1  ORF type:complete len:261 (+),score=62.72 TRINITY_DN12099_c0_g1_i2:307-1089(+)
MSFLQGRLGAIEGKYFKEESSQAAARLRERLSPSSATPSSSPAAAAAAHDAAVDVVPSILQHSLPLSNPQQPSPSFVRGSAILERPDVDAASLRRNPQSIVHLPETRLGRSKYALEAPQRWGASPSTANMRRGATSASAQKITSLAKGLGQVSRAFGVATVLVYGGGAVAFVVLCKAMGADSLEAIPEKGQEMLRPQAEAMRARFAPWREWATRTQERWRLTEEGQRRIGFQFAKAFGVEQSGTPTGAKDGEIRSQEVVG